MNEYTFSLYIYIYISLYIYSYSFTCIVIYNNPLATFGGYIVSSHVFAFSCNPLTTVVQRCVQVFIARCFPRNRRAQSNRQGGLATVLHHDLGGLDHVRSADCNKSTPATRKTAVMTCSGYSNSFTCIVIYSNPLATFACLGGYIVSCFRFFV